MSKIYELYIEANAKAEERESLYGHMAVIISIVSLFAIIIGAVALLFKSLQMFHIAFIVAIMCFGGNLLRVFVRNQVWHGFVSALIRTCFVIAVFLALMFVFANVVDLYQFVLDGFSTTKDFNAVSIRYQYSVLIANLAAHIMSRIV